MSHDHSLLAAPNRFCRGGINFFKGNVPKTPPSASLETGSGPRRCIRNGVSGEREVEGDNEAQNRTTSEPPPPLTEPHPPAPDCTGQHEWSFSRDSLIHALGGVFTFATQSKPTCPVPPPPPMESAPRASALHAQPWHQSVRLRIASCKRG